MTTKIKFLKPDDDSFSSERDALSVDDAVSTFIFNPHHSLSLQTQRERLPIRQYRDRILYCLENYQTLVLVGETGSGKSTQVPQYLYEFGWHTKGIIGVTEPRRVAAVSLSDRVATERGELVGETVGVAIRFINKFSENTMIKFMTEGILLREMLADPLLSQYSVIMIDEAHERNNLTDTLMGLLKKIAKKRQSLKIIISSATVDAELFKDFFNFNTKKAGKDTSVILSVEGRMYPYEIFYLQEPCPDYIQGTIDTVMKIHQKEPPGDILAFLTGQEEVLRAVNALKDLLNEMGREDMQVLSIK
ncbi:probable ATP-dependent RNA helicase DHX35 [Culicoides brevitarsis]|uniref:probable ATP-dependent RNA helicase DHX35 n=1 Tax=Culicoides brevitarsis TaxID=469753 RepID=UPI00307C0D72